MGRSKILVLIGLVAFTAMACASNANEGEGGSTGGNANCDGDIRVGVSLDVGGLGDKSFNDAAKRGLDKAIADGLVCEENTKFVEANATGSNRDSNTQALADEGFDLIVANGFAFSPGVAEFADQYPDTNFGVIDGYATTINTKASNIADLTFKEQEGSFLVGAAAAIKCGCDTIGFLGGQTGPLIGKFEAGYTAGAKYVDPNIDVLVEYIGDDVTAFNDPTKGEALAQKLFDDGSQVVYHAAGASGAGLFSSVEDEPADVLAIGVDSDQYLTASAAQKPHILTSMLKRVDTAVYNAIQQTGDGTFKPGFQVFGLAEDGVDYSKSNTDLMTQDVIDQVDEIKQKIIDGEITVPEKPEDV